jgi:mannose/cellobiose epimerase-like protein (N-acyl-D-glucosamine 2-epimerase family)
MKRRNFLASIPAAAAAPSFLAADKGLYSPAAQAEKAKAPALAGKSLADLRTGFQHDLQEYVEFFIRHGIDHEKGGFMCSLDHDGTLVDTNKFHWFQGRGVWVFSHLYLHFRKDPQYLEIARKTCDFMLRYFPQDKERMRWAAVVAKDGGVVRGYENDPFGCYFGIAGMLELAEAAGDEKLFNEALDLYLRHYAFVRDPKILAEADPPGRRGFNLEMADLQIATQILRRKNMPEVKKLADESLAAIRDRFYYPEIKLFNEVLDQNLNRIPELRNYANPGHDIEIMWLVMDEALRRNDRALFNWAKDKIIDLLEIGWDHVYGGIVHGVNVGAGCYEWPAVKPSGMTVEFRERGEYNYVKAHWAISEILVATLMVCEHKGEEWAARYFGRALEINDRKLSLRPHGYPLHLLFTDRQFTFQPHTMRKDNYHYVRAAMRCIKMLDRMIAKAGG